VFKSIVEIFPSKRYNDFKLCKTQEESFMSRLGIFMADGCEEIEGLTVVDIMRRAGIEITMISISGRPEVTSSHGVTFFADELKSGVDFDALDGIVLPGGMPGTLNLGADETVTAVVRDFAAKGKLVAAICAAPGVLGQTGILNGKKATCHPGFEDKLTGAECSTEPVVRDGNIITSRGMGTAIPFALEIVRYFLDDAAVGKVCGGLVYAG
jgi:4-methyl-5(b-hydroxyethyl)-thiazole monophosphate biosynthesis